MKFNLWFFLVFLSIFILIYGGAHLYIYWRLIYPLKLSTLWLILIAAILSLLCISFPLIHFISRPHNGPLLTYINYISSLWMGMLIYFCLTTLGFDIFKLIINLTRSTWLLTPGRQALLVTAITGFLTLYGLIEAANIGVNNIQIRIANLPKNLQGLSIAQISDVHMGLIVNGRRLEKIITMVNNLHPDLIVITGDLVDEQALHMEEMVEPLRKLKSRYGIFAVTGNHEYIAGVDKAVAFIEKAGIPVLRNRWVTVNSNLQLVGRDDPAGKWIAGEQTQALKEIMKGIDKNKPIILLYHTPVTTMEELKSLGINLQLSGHTHKGQLWPIHYIVKMLFKTHYGLFNSDNTSIYVSPGTGTWGPPMRVGARPEITLIRLQRQ